MRHSTNYALMACVLKTFKPSIFEKIVKDQMLKVITDEEMNSILKNDTLKLTELPPKNKPIKY